MTRQEKWDRRFLDDAQHISTRSKDPSTKVGAVIVDTDLSIISQGYNGFARGVEDTEERLNDRAVKYDLVVHGEVNAILFARRDLRGTTLYTWPFMPCVRCASIVVQAGIKRVVSVKNDNPRWVASFKLTEMVFREAGVELVLY